jgi:SNF2 family DNA or RNA helicase
MQVVNDKVMLVYTKQPHTITEAIAKSQVVDRDGDEYTVAVRWGLEEAQALAALQHANVPSPIERDYKWTGKLTPFAHQKTTAAFLTLNPKSFCFSEAGTGKTASTIWAADYLMKLGKIKRVLVLCPVSIMRAAWQQDLFKFAMHRSCSVAHGDAKTRAKIIKAGAEFVIINYDGLAVVKDEVLKGGFDLIIVDEATAYKNPQTNRWKVLKEVAAKASWMWMLTGTPAAQSPVDAFGLAKLINPRMASMYFGQFRDRVMFKLTQFQWAPRPEAKALVHDALQPAIRFEKRDCLDLPPVTHVDREAPLTAQQRKYYASLKSQMRIEAAGEDITAVNAAAKLNKLLQISGGAVYSDTGDVVEFDVSNRINVVLEVIEETANKVLIFVPFTHTITLLKEALEHHGVTCAVLSGKVSMNQRSETVQDFQNKPNPRVLIIQPQAAAHGLTLTAADTIIWYAPVTSVETYLQANARNDRPGQVNPMTVVHIRGSDVEDKLYAMLRGKVNNHTKLVDLYRSEIDS